MKPKHNSRAGYSSVLVLVLFVLLASGGYFAYRTFMKPVSVNREATESSSEETVELSPVIAVRVNQRMAILEDFAAESNIASLIELGKVKGEITAGEIKKLDEKWKAAKEGDGY